MFWHLNVAVKKCEVNLIFLLVSQEKIHLIFLYYVINSEIKHLFWGGMFGGVLLACKYKLLRVKEMLQLTCTVLQGLAYDGPWVRAGLRPRSRSES